MFGIATYSTTKGIKISDTAWDVYDTDDFVSNNSSKGVSIDLSKLNSSRNNYIAIRSESHDPIYIKMGASATVQNAEHNASENKVTVTIRKSLSNSTFEKAELEYRTPYGSWNHFGIYENGSLNDNNASMQKILKKYQNEGASLYIRAKAKFNSLSDNNTIANIKDAKTGKDVTCYDGGSMPSKEAILRIVKKANGPSVAIDYVKSTVDIPANAEYRVCASGGAFSSPTKTTGKTLLEVKNGVFGQSVTATSGVLEVRRVAQGKKIPASKWTHVKIEIQDPIKPNPGFGTNATISTTSTTSALAVADGIEITPMIKTQPQTVYKGYIFLTVKDSYKYNVNFKIASSQEGLKGAKPITVKSGKTVQVKAPIDSFIQVAIAGDKKNKIWASDYVDIGKIVD